MSKKQTTIQQAEEDLDFVTAEEHESAVNGGGAVVPMAGWSERPVAKPSVVGAALEEIVELARASNARGGFDARGAHISREKLRLEKALSDPKDRAQTVRDVLRSLGAPVTAPA